MLLETKRGKENKVAIPVGTEDTVGHHTWTREGGYQPIPYVHQEFPKGLYRRREVAEAEVVTLLNDLFGLESEEDRQEVYLNAMQHIGESGIDVRSWPMTCPTDAMLKSMQSVLRLHAREQQQDVWLSENPGKLPVDYKKFIMSPETCVVNSAKEEEEKFAEGWCLTAACEPKE